MAKGGRYDTLMDHFGKPAPATGFAFVVDRLMSALSRQKIGAEPQAPRVLIVYRASQAKKAIEKAVEYRRQGIAAEMAQERIGKDYQAYAEKNGIREIIRIEG